MSKLSIHDRQVLAGIESRLRADDPAYVSQFEHAAHGTLGPAAGWRGCEVRLLAVMVLSMLLPLIAVLAPIALMSAATLLAVGVFAARRLRHRGRRHAPLPGR